MSRLRIAALLTLAPLACGTAADTPSPDRARVFERNPVATPEPIEITLPRVADDADGSLISALDAQGIRALRVVSCEDEGQTVLVPGVGMQRICTLRPRASKRQHGNFVYEDWDAAVRGEYDPHDVHAEVSLYYHARRFYDALIDPAVGLFTHIPERHQGPAGPVPITLVANYRLPDGEAPLAPVAMAMYAPQELLRQGLAGLRGLMGCEGDVLAFGQGPHADFAYDGETVYHELGHLVNRATAGLSYDLYADAQGLCNLGNALEQGLAETLVFLVSGRTRLFDYIDATVPGGGFLREVDNDAVFPDALRGIDQFDGLIVAGANHELFVRLQAEAGYTRPLFVRLILDTLQHLDPPGGHHDFGHYAETLLARLAAEPAAPAGALDLAREVLDARGLLRSERAFDLGAAADREDLTLFIGGALDAMWNTSLQIDDQGETARVAPGFVQAFVSPPAGATRVVITALLLPLPDPFALVPDDDDHDVRLYLRHGAAVHYDLGTSPVAVTRDGSIAAALQTVSTPGGEALQATWVVDGLAAGTRSYLHPVNHGTAPAALAGIELRFE